jgi:hypothetical protein
MASRAQWKIWFETGKKPLGTQFANVFDLLFKKDEDELPIASITNLQTVLNNKADKSVVDALNSRTVLLEPGTTSWLVPADTTIEKFIIKAPTPINFICGTTEGGNDIIDEFAVAGLKPYSLDHPFDVATTIYFGGISGDTIIKILRA